MENVKSNLKEIGGWGIKNPFLFCQYLATKFMWRLIQNPGSFWGKVLVSKYFPNGSIQERIKKLDKTFKTKSIVWNAFVQEFPQVGNWIAWYAGNGKEVRVWEDPWLGSAERYKISGALIQNIISSRISNHVHF